MEQTEQVSADVDAEQAEPLSADVNQEQAVKASADVTTLTAEESAPSDDSQTCSVSVTYTEDAQIPEGSFLTVNEIAPEAYDEFVAMAAQALGSTAGSVSYAKFFDINAAFFFGNQNNTL